jgi:hypothetical protein
MRGLALVGLVALLSGCGPESAEEVAPTAEAEKTQQAPESWCRSYTTQQYCPKYVCSWYSDPAPGYCGLPATSAQ